MSGRMSQRKGRAGEIELSNILSGYGYDVKPGMAVSFGGTPDLTGLPGVHVECKRRETADLTAWLKQAAEDAAYFGDGLPAVFWRHNKGKWTVTMSLDDWMVLYKTRFTTQKNAERRTANDNEADKGATMPFDSVHKGGGGTDGRSE